MTKFTKVTRPCNRVGSPSERIPANPRLLPMIVTDEKLTARRSSRGSVDFTLRLLSRFPHAVRGAALVAIAFGLAAASNAMHPLGIRWLQSPDGRIGIPRVFESRLPEISAKDGFALIKSGTAVVIDARDQKDYHKDHIPGAISIPMRKWAEVWPPFAGKPPRNTPILIYCYGGECGLATRMGKRLLELGYEKPIVLRRGWTAWVKAGYPTLRKPQGAAG